MRHLKILGLSLLALLGVMAVSASMAQAKWKLDPVTQHVSGVLLLALEGEVLLGELLVAGLGLEIHCPTGTTNIVLQTNAAMTVLTGGGTATFNNCIVLNFSEVCTVKSPGAAAKTIVAKGEGEAKMVGSETFAELSSANFTEIEFSGAECPFLELGAKVNGSVKLTLHNAGTLEKIHLALLNEIALKYGNEKALLDGELLTPGVHDDAVLAHVKEVNNAPWAILLEGL